MKIGRGGDLYKTKSRCPILFFNHTILRVDCFHPVFGKFLNVIILDDDSWYLNRGVKWANVQSCMFFLADYQSDIF